MRQHKLLTLCACPETISVFQKNARAPRGYCHSEENVEERLHYTVH